MVERGSIPYSPDIHPLPELRKNAGTVSSTDAVQMTRVFPISISAEPSAVEMKSGTMLTGRICSGVRLSLRKIIDRILTAIRFQLSAFSHHLLAVYGVRGCVQLGWLVLWRCF